MKLYRNREWLEEQYIGNKLSTASVGELADCSDHTIGVWLRKFSIPVRTLSEASKIVWADPGLRARHSKIMKDAYADPEVLAKLGKALKAAWSDPESKERRSKIMKDAYAGSEVRERCRRATIANIKRGCMDQFRQSQLLTKYEQLFADELDKQGIFYLTQFRPDDCQYFYDFFIPVIRMVIEINGHWRHYTDEGILHDIEKSRWARDKGYTVVIVQNKEIKKQGVEKIVARQILQT